MIWPLLAVYLSAGMLVDLFAEIEHREAGKSPGRTMGDHCLFLVLWPLVVVTWAATLVSRVRR